MPKYHIKQIVVTEPVVELPEGSQVVSVEHRTAGHNLDIGVEWSEHWNVCYLESDVKEERH